MLFNSLQFVFFFAFVTLLYYLAQPFGAIRKYLLLFASYYFYGCWNYKYLILILLCTVTTYGTALLYERTERKNVIYAGITFNFSILFLFKYLNWGIASMNMVLQLAGRPYTFDILNIVLPVGISFYTFQAAGYLIDVSRGDVSVERDFVSYALFVSFYPQLVAGPIERTKHLMPQIKNMDSIKMDYDMVVSGLITMLYGFFVKVVLADRLSYIVDCVWVQYQYIHGLWLWVGAVFFAFQIYCDFLGYSTIALGAAKTMGIMLSENFQTPYFAESLQEFWRRWHISLSSWFRDYVYIPLGGNRRGRMRVKFNLLCTFLLSGMWHGASWHFVVWGGIHGVLLSMENEIKRRMALPHNAGIVLVKRMVVFLVVTIAWVFFRAPSTIDAFRYIRDMFSNHNQTSLVWYGFERWDWVVLLIGGIVMLALNTMKYRSKMEMGCLIYEKPLVWRWAISAVLIFLIVFCGRYGETLPTTPFLYFQF